MTAPSIPNHVGYILDGNRRWAKQHGLPTYEGHLAGYNAFKDVIVATAELGVKFISFYTFSTKNWDRAENEIAGIMSLVRRLFKTDIHELIERDYRVIVMGSRERLPQDICQMIEDAEQRSADCQAATLVMCFNYGGQDEIVRASQRLLTAGLSPEEVTAEQFAKMLDAPEVPDCDLIVRTSGEQRLSDFMLWRAAYSELIFLDKFWPEMTTEDVSAIMNEYGKRQRRFGG